MVGPLDKLEHGMIPDPDEEDAAKTKMAAGVIRPGRWGGMKLIRPGDPSPSKVSH